MRWYTVIDPPGTEPVKLPSVTSILDVTMAQPRRDTLVRAEMANPKAFTLNREAAIAKGVAVDDWVKDCLTAGRSLPYPHPVERHCKRLAPLVRGIIRKAGPVWTNEVVYSVALGCAGTLDVVATLPTGLRTLIELKTSAYTIWPEAVAEAQLQAIAYFILWGKRYPNRPLDAIATYHVTPYMLHEQVISTPQALTKLIAAWTHRQKLFASRFNQLEV